MMVGVGSLRPVAAKPKVMLMDGWSENCNCNCRCHSRNSNSLSLSISRNRNNNNKRSCTCTAGISVESEVEAESTRSRRVSSSGAFYVLDGMPQPLGPTSTSDHGKVKGVNFALYSSRASAVSLCLFTLPHLHAGRITEVIPLDPDTNRTGNVWHVLLSPCPTNTNNPTNTKLEELEELEHMLYGFQLDGDFCPHQGLYFDSSNVLLDPYAKAVVVSREAYGLVGPSPSPSADCWPQLAGMIPSPASHDDFDWQGDRPLGLHHKDLIIYEMHIRGYTNHDSSNVHHPGTYASAVQKLDHLRELGINCIELMPCHEFNELEYFDHNPVMGQHKMNFWGYSTVNFFSPMMRYAAAGHRNCGRDAIKEFKTLVREAHKSGIEVIMDVVFNHTAEGNENGPILSFRGIDNSTYYMLAPKGEFYNYSGCGNTFNCNHPVVRQFIVDCLRYWVTEMHIDGFRFDLASIMTRGSSLWDPMNVYGYALEGDGITTGTPLPNPPLIDMISNDPILCGVKLIAEAWDAGGLYQVGQFPHWNIWSEWNGQYRDVVRQFIKGTNGFAGGFAECLCGSPNLYQGGGRKPWHSVNFVCAHDGFTLADLVTYNNKYNLANGEDNRDGENHNLSWNCGEEGEFASMGVRRLRKRQMRNFFVCLMVSQGVPMIYMGDEYGHTKGGNNNTYCHDNYLNYFRWDRKEEQSCDLYRFCRLLIKFRRECECLGMDDFPTAQQLQWHGHQPGMPDWSDTSRFVAFSMNDEVKGEIYVAFNTSHLPVVVTLPDRPGYRWDPLVDTSKPAPFDFLSEDLPDRVTAVRQFANFLDSNLYPMLSYSSVILVLRPEDA
ncbi:Glycogen debranching enzyme [Rhynchospora pubera]|uniref:isoamylase n=1 Tax=Rhynchospora pubera TaxID=906938 RepID=A0AAV8GF39_9POAL|nr:Glycogen debranching enzyme [Rhynchospora pubera]KAJ4802036.1 Glycogen debranching enzyme [Rhynchospora pubera]